MIFHFGTFHLPLDLAHGLSRAVLAFTENGFQVLVPSKDLGFSVVGGNSQVTVTVICVPQANGLSVTVIAASEVSATAEHARNNVRQVIITAPIH